MLATTIYLKHERIEIDSRIKRQRELLRRGVSDSSDVADLTILVELEEGHLKHIDNKIDVIALADEIEAARRFADTGDHIFLERINPHRRLVMEQEAVSFRTMSEQEVLRRLKELLSAYAEERSMLKVRLETEIQQWEEGDYQRVKSQIEQGRAKRNGEQSKHELDQAEVRPQLTRPVEDVDDEAVDDGSKVEWTKSQTDLGRLAYALFDQGFLAESIGTRSAALKVLCSLCTKNGKKIVNTETMRKNLDKII